MTELAKTLLNLRSLRAFARDLTLEQLEEAYSRFTTVIEERREEQEKIDAEEAERNSKLEAIAKDIAEQGVDVEELIAALSNKSTSKSKAKREPRPAKYKYTDADGVEKKWTGQGRTPSAIQTALDNGAKIDDFLI